MRPCRLFPLAGRVVASGRAGAGGIQDGFSLVELLLVVLVVGVVLAVMIPLGLRTRVTATYGVLRQNCSELAAYTSQWVHQAILTQDERRSTATVADYYGSLAGLSHAPRMGFAPGQWLADTVGPSNWHPRSGPAGAARRCIEGRVVDTAPCSAPGQTVEAILPRDYPILNPFTRTGLFDPVNFPRSVADGGRGAVPGAVAFGGGRQTPDGWIHFALVFQGVDSTATQLDDPGTFLAGMGLDSLLGLHNGVFVARMR